MRAKERDTEDIAEDVEEDTEYTGYNEEVNPAEDEKERLMSVLMGLLLPMKEETLLTTTKMMKKALKSTSTASLAKILMHDSRRVPTTPITNPFHSYHTQDPNNTEESLVETLKKQGLKIIEC